MTWKERCSGRLRNLTRSATWALCLFVGVSGCMGRSCGRLDEGPEEPLSTRPSLDLRGNDMVDQLKADVRQLATPEGRMVGTRGHDSAREYLLGRMREAGLEPYDADSFECPYEVDGIQFVNLIGRLAATNPGLPPVLIAAHYDTCGPYPGADDNAAAIAIALATVESLRGRQLKRDVIFAFFDAEEPPHYLSLSMGSIHWYNHQRNGPVHCAVVLDLVGHDVPIPGLEDVVALTGMETDPDLAQVVRDCEPMGSLQTIPTLNRYVGDLSDHHVFRVNRRPYLFLSCGRWSHYHQPTDTHEKLSYEKMAAITGYLVNVLCAVAAKPLEGPFEGYDSTETELYFLRKTLGPLVAGMGLKLESRQDIDTVTQLLVGQFGL